MTVPWKGAARPMSVGSYASAATKLGCEPAAIRAVFEVESANRMWEKDGSLLRRFEPHKMPGSKLTWRDSLKIKSTDRERMFLDAYGSHPDAALRATSWGGPQIMGFNAREAGFKTADSMVRHMADRGDMQFDAFVNLVHEWGLTTYIRAHDWYNFAVRYNGKGQPETYARKIEAAYRRASGKRSPTVLRLGSTGPDVQRLQESLGVSADGIFGKQTETAVTTFQNQTGLQVDGVVGQKTWTALERERDAKPAAQATQADRVADAVKKWGGVLSGATATGAGVQRLLPEGAFTVLAYGAVTLALVAAGAYLVRRMRRNA